MSRRRNHRRYYLLSLGCPKNTVDSEGMAALLQGQGYQATAIPEQAQVLIVNTCGFLEAAKEESIAHLQALAERKRPGQLLIAAGCLAQRNPEEIKARVPGVDGLLGTRRWMEILRLVELLRHDRRGGRHLAVRELLGDPDTPQPIARPTHVGPSAYLKIADGCNAPCAFCSIPLFKGKLRSRPLADLVDEATRLTAGGAREIILIAQDTTDYGRDRGEPDSLPRLVNALVNRVPDLHWLRIMYAYPGHVSERLIEVMAQHPQVLHYLDIPLQHGDPRTLRRMRRPANLDMVFRTIEKLRSAMPDIALRTTFIVGFPGETEEEFENLLEFVSAIRFDKVGAFTFSPEPGTPAATMPDQVPEEVKEERWHRLMALQQRISLERNQEQVGRVLEVLAEQVVEGKALEEMGFVGPPDAVYTLARSYREAPEIDGAVIVPGRLEVGTFHRVRITAALEYDLVAEPVSIPVEVAEVMHPGGV